MNRRWGKKTAPGKLAGGTLAVLVSLVLWSAARRSFEPSDLNEQLSARRSEDLERLDREHRFRSALKLHTELNVGPYAEPLREIYFRRAYRPIWIGPDQTKAEGRALVERLLAADQEGLHIADYHLAKIERLIREAYPGGTAGEGPSAFKLAELELAFSDSFMFYTDHLASGCIPPAKIYNNWYLVQPRLSPVAVLEEALERGVSRTLYDVAARHRGYRALREALVQYRLLQKQGGWPTLPEGDRLKEGAAGERVLALRRRLAVTGDLRGNVHDALFDEALKEGVERFQRRHGLAVDGAVGMSTIAALNVPVEERIRQLELNLERHRWLPESFGQDYVLINIPEFHLYAYRGGKLRFKMPVIVGRRLARTPVFADEIRYVVFNPYWNVPVNIATREILPHLESDPLYLADNDYEVVSSDGEALDLSFLSNPTLARGAVRIRQRPGPRNALGRIKFIFPNDHDVYIHDTPARHLFSRAERDFSHGCIRIQNPRALAHFLLESQWPPDSIARAAEAGREQWVRVHRPVPVIILYMTAWAENDGAVHFRNDVYGLDGILSEAVERSAPSDGWLCSLPLQP